ncbi:hypothetical protein EMGBS15_12770 [Filimonas sp.]|nr:hypothetical protein EMGBS15_12770 [Filimonas sp.]
MKNYDTLSEAINDLVQQGYTANFNLKGDCIEDLDTDIPLHPEDFEIDEIHRFEGMTDPDDQSILYAISSVTHQVKGLLVNAYGMYADAYSAELAAKLKMHK